MQLIQLLVFVGLATALAAPGGGPDRNGDHGHDDNHGHGGSSRGSPTCGQAYEDCQRRGQHLCCQGHKGKHCHTMTQGDYQKYYNQPLTAWCKTTPRQYTHSFWNSWQSQQCHRECSQTQIVSIYQQIPLQSCSPYTW